MQRPRIVYSYTVNNNLYKSDQISEGWKLSSNVAFFAKRKAARYPPGQPVEVFYDPDNPARAMLDRKVKGGSFTYLIGLALLAAAVKAAGYF